MTKVNGNEEIYSLMINLKARATDAEIMDDFTLPASEVVPVLKGLEKMNTLFGGNDTIINALKELSVQNEYHIGDWGCGGGDILRAIAKWAAKRKLQINLTGVDATEATVLYAETQAKAFSNIHFILADVMDDRLTENQFDIVYSSLFTHHFKDEDWIALVKKMVYCSKHAVIITDLHRHWLSYYGVVAVTRVFVNNKMAGNDGPLSVRRSFTKAELVKLLKDAGIPDYKITWHWAFKWKIVIRKTQ